MTIGDPLGTALWAASMVPAAPSATTTAAAHAMATVLPNLILPPLSLVEAPTSLRLDS
jgi:hypothetical protein